MAIDPVCGMTVDEKSKLTVTHSKIKYYFCSTSCQEAFRSSPANYLGNAGKAKESSAHKAQHSHHHDSKAGADTDELS